MPSGESELILNADGSIYHLNLRPEDIATTLIFVGDPDRVPQVSNHFDTIEIVKGKREFHTHTGTLNGKRLSVISTGIGTDNIDIVLNELDALVNMNFATREPVKEKTSLQIVRIGTSGAVQEHIPVDSFLLSNYAIGLDGLLHFYKTGNHTERELTQQLAQHLDWHTQSIHPYAFKCNESLKNQLADDAVQLGITVTNAGFYGPQGRRLRLKEQLSDFHSKLQSFSYGGSPITNLEMETAGIYGLSALMGHKAISMNAILANRALGTFSKNPQQTVQKLIAYCLDRLTQS